MLEVPHIQTIDLRNHSISIHTIDPFYYDNCSPGLLTRACILCGKEPSSQSTIHIPKGSIRCILVLVGLKDLADRSIREENSRLLYIILEHSLRLFILVL